MVVDLGDVMLDIQEVAALLRVSPSTVKRARYAGRLRGVRVSGRIVRYRGSDVQAYLDLLQQGEVTCQGTK